jgi:hypothetical protein
MKNESNATGYCKVCLLVHDEEMHQATLAVRKWHRWQVVKGFEETNDDVVEVPELIEPRVA